MNDIKQFVQDSKKWRTLVYKIVKKKKSTNLFNQGEDNGKPLLLEYCFVYLEGSPVVTGQTPPSLMFKGRRLDFWTSCVPSKPTYIRESE